MANKFIAGGGLQLTRQEAEAMVRAQYAERLRGAAADPDEQQRLEAEIQQQIELRLRQPKHSSPYNLY